MQAKMKIAAARILAAKAAPYFSHALYSLIPIESKASLIPGHPPTIGVTKGFFLLYEKAFIDAVEPKHLAAVLWHEINHIIREHSKRREAGGFSPGKWNRNADREINDDKPNSLEFPPKSLTGIEPCMPYQIGAPNGLTAEKYYQLDEDDEEEIVVVCGSCCGNPFEDESAAAGADGKPDSPAPRTDVEVHNIRAQTAEAIKAASPGTVPAGLKLWAEKELAPRKIPWTKQLQIQVRRSIAMRPGMVDLRFSKPSRRQAGLGYGPGSPILPSFFAPVPNVLVAVDTSGSMDGLLERACAECDAVLAALGAKVSFLSCDTKTYGLSRIDKIGTFNHRLMGGGGTDFRPVFEAADKMRPRPEVMIFFTDGEGPAPSHPPHGIRVIWGMLGRHRQRPVTWGIFIDVD